MASVIDQAMVAPLTRTTRGGDVLRRPARIEAEIAAALQLSAGEILARAGATPEESISEQRMSEECMVHLIRRELRADSPLRHGTGSPRRGASGKEPRRGASGTMAEGLTPLLLERCDRSLRGSIRGFPPSAATEIREEVLGRLAVSLAGPGDEADFLEVRFALALKRLRIDVCRRERRRLQGLVALEDVAAGSGDDHEPATVDRSPPSPPSQEDRLLIRQALAALTAEERKVLVLHKLAGVPLSSSVDAGATLVGLLGRSERTLRNRLRSAEAKLEQHQRGNPDER